MNLGVGTSGFSYKEWKGKFYPEKHPANAMLEYYGTKLTSVEINNTFYRMPQPSLLEGWAAKVPESFRFSLKASRRISHFKKLKDAAEETRYFVETAKVLGVRLGVILFQLPPNAKKDLDVLDSFLKEALPEGTRAAFEFRHDSWLSDDVYDRLRESGCALCIADTDEGCTPFVSTADWGYLRLRGTTYADDDLGDWVKRVQGAGWKDAFVFFKHEDEAAGPLMAMKFREIAGA
ncbi:MAG TPA: DUF72 domain-containing protein [bacterium]|nr:DUF72 domain-containing protein [bacterium]